MSNASSATPLWRTIWDFPLVAMLVGGALFVAAWLGTDYLFWESPLDFGEVGNLWAGTLLPIIVGLLLYKFVIAKMGRTKRDDLPAEGMIGDTALGLAAGAAIFTLVVGIASVLGVFRVVGWGTSTDLLQVILVSGVAASIFQGVLLRGIFFRFFEEFAGSWMALIALSVLVGADHYLGADSTALSAVAFGLESGVLLGGAYLLTRSLWLTIGVHAGWSIAQAYIWGLPVSGSQYDGLVNGQLYGADMLSGGLFGLEASVIALGVATAAGLWMAWQAAKADNIVKPMWSRG